MMLIFSSVNYRYEAFDAVEPSLFIAVSCSNASLTMSASGPGIWVVHILSLILSHTTHEKGGCTCPKTMDDNSTCPEVEDWKLHFLEILKKYSEHFLAWKTTPLEMVEHFNEIESCENLYLTCQVNNLKPVSWSPLLNWFTRIG